MPTNWRCCSRGSTSPRHAAPCAGTRRFDLRSLLVSRAESSTSPNEKSCGEPLTGIGAMRFLWRMSEATARATQTKQELRGSVLDVLRELLAGRHDEEVLALVTKLVARNHELELLLGKLRESKNRGEHISAGQLDLFLDKLKGLADGDLAEANKKLEDAAKKNGG